MSEEFKYDAYISYSSKDKRRVRKLAERLKADGLRVWFDEWEIRPGDSILSKIEQGLEHSKTLILVMSANAFASDWVTLERNTAMFRDPTNDERRFIPVRLDDAEVKYALRQFASIDWRQQSEEQYAKLLAACRPTSIASPLEAEPNIEQPQRMLLRGHTNWVWGVAMTPDGKRAISGSNDSTVRVWDLESGNCVATLEGHTGSVWGVAMTPDGKRAVSGSQDHTVRIWDLTPESKADRYTNAKVLLVGDTGVGKSGLAIRLTENRFESTISTDAAWATQLQLPHNVSTSEIEREIWLWDFAGQADYRLIHQLYMDETSLAVLVFNPQSENPFEGLGQWERDLQKSARRPFKKLLVAGRCDRGGLMISRANIDASARSVASPIIWKPAHTQGQVALNSAKQLSTTFPGMIFRGLPRRASSSFSKKRL